MVVQKRMSQTYHRLGELLVRKNLVETGEIDEALALQRAAISQGKKPPRLGQILEKRRLLTSEEVRKIIQEQKIHRGEAKILNVELEEKDAIAVLTLSGRLDARRSPSLTRVLERIMNRGVAQIIFQCSELGYIDSHGASTFVAYIDEARARGGDIKFLKVSPDCRLILENLGLNQFIQMFETEEETFQAFDLPIDEYLSKGALGEYVAAEKGRTFHLSYCTAAQKIREEQRLYYQSKWHARQDKKHPCRVCQP